MTKVYTLEGGCHHLSSRTHKLYVALSHPLSHAGALHSYPLGSPKEHRPTKVTQVSPGTQQPRPSHLITLSHYWTHTFLSHSVTFTHSQRTSVFLRQSHPSTAAHNGVRPLPIPNVWNFPQHNVQHFLELLYFLHILIHIRITVTTYTFLPINTHIKQNISYTRISPRATITGPQLPLIHTHPEISLSFDTHSPPEMRPIGTRSHQETLTHVWGSTTQVVSR